MNKKIVTLITVTLVVALVTTCGVAQSEEDQASEKTFYMFVQTADSGSFVPVEGEENLYHLTLEGVSANTTYFSDRPERVVGQAPMGDFLEGLCFSEDNPPNAALEILEAEGSTDLVVLELFDPAYHPESNTLEYTASILQEPDHSYAVYNERHDEEIPESFEANSLFIDDCSSVTVECRKSDETICGQLSCCQCWGGFPGMCGFQDDCCSIESCEDECAKKYGDECRHAHHYRN